MAKKANKQSENAGKVPKQAKKESKVAVAKEAPKAAKAESKKKPVAPKKATDGQPKV